MIQAVGMPRDGAFWGRFKASPFFDQAILDAAEALIEHEHLGQGKATDLLALGLSATDYVGHAFGNQGPEMRDQIRRLDRALGLFLARLRKRNPGAWVVLTADHGGSDFPERLQAQGIAAKRLDIAAWGRALDRAVAQRLGVAGPLFRIADSAQFYLDQEALRASGQSRSEVLGAAAELAKKDSDGDGVIDMSPCDP